MKIECPVPATKVFVDEDVIIIGMADGTMKLYDCESRLFLSQLNVIPVAARGNADAINAPGNSSSELSRAPTYLQHKISFLARTDEMVISAMLDPTAPTPTTRQLEISIWPLRALNAVQPLKSKCLPGNVLFVNFDRRSGYLVALSQYGYGGPSSPGSPTLSSYDVHSSPMGSRHAILSSANRDVPAYLTAIANSGPLIALSWQPPFKSLMMDGLKWRESNDQQQAKLAQEVMEQVLLEVSFFKAMFMVDADSEEVEHVVSSMFACLAGKEAHAAQFIETAIEAEILLRRHGVSSSSSSSSSGQVSPHAANGSNGPSLSDGRDRLANSTSISSSASNSTSPEVARPKRNSTAAANPVLVASPSAPAISNIKNSLESSSGGNASLHASKDGIGAHRDGSPVHSSSSTHTSSNGGREASRSAGGSSDSSSAPPQYFPPHAMTTAVITSVLQDMCAPYLDAVLSRPLAILSAKGVASHMIFSLPSTHAAPEDQPMFNALIKVTAGIVDGLIEHQAKLALPAHKMLVAIHQAVCADNTSDSELRSFRRGAARVFLDHVLLKSWLDPVGAQLVTKVSDEMRHNLRIVAQLLQVICGYSKHKLTDPSLCSLVTEYSTKWRSWLLSKVSDTSILPAAARTGSSSALDRVHYDMELGIFGGSPKLKDRKEKEKDKRAKIARGTSFINAPKATNAKAAAMVVTKYIITHAGSLLEVMNRGRGRTPDPTAIRIRALADSLVMPIMTMMAKQGTKDMHLAASLRVFGKAGQGTGHFGSETSRSSGTASSSESISSESYGGNNAHTNSSSPLMPRSAATSPQISSAHGATKSTRRRSDRRVKRATKDTASPGEERRRSFDGGEKQDGSGSDRESSPRRSKKVMMPPTVIYIPDKTLGTSVASDSEGLGASLTDSTGQPSPNSNGHISPNTGSTRSPSLNPRAISPRKTKKKKSGTSLSASQADDDISSSDSHLSPTAAATAVSPGTAARTRKGTDGIPLTDERSTLSRENSPIRPIVSSGSPSVLKSSPKTAVKRSVARKPSADLKLEQAK